MPVSAWLALIPLGIAVTALHATWNGRLSRGVGLGASGVLIVSAMVAASQSLGAGRGINWILIAVSIAAAIALWLGRTRKPRKFHMERHAEPATEWPDWPVRWLMAGPLAGLAAVAMGAAAAALSPFASGTNVMAGLFVVLIVWAVAAVWVAGTSRRLRTTGILTATILVGSGGSAAHFLL
ncbi:hypothetical protein [Parasphingorhabdus cellanae]|uniref:Uncharacterized protein n=1 Tax=Parasphingorhabdus cellanae TaxID=2806553 RepID=A0ABX7T129_9SPHN|nr:hypothetical protein [Parasphingorhabdus cellanae]QTD54472.1 hypothetical protein J4G78_09180 [Parasphingorhabdus cellanae]